MLRIFVFRKKSAGWKIILGAGLIAGCCLAAPAADTIRGVARNQTRGQFAAGDEVILLRLGMSGLDQAGLEPPADAGGGAHI